MYDTEILTKSIFITRYVVWRRCI